MLASTGFVLEYDYATLQDFWGGAGLLASWVQLFGVISAAVLVVWFIACAAYWLASSEGASGVHAVPGFLSVSSRARSFYGLTGRLARVSDEEVWKPRSFWMLCVLAAAGLGVTGGVLLFQGLNQGWNAVRLEPAHWGGALASIFWVGCIAAILAVSWEFLLDVGKFSPRRIWALARFSIKEAVRRRALWSFCVILAIFLFASWFMPIYRRPEDQWRNYVDLVFFMTTALLLLTASVLACFSLPTDIQRQTIHTVVTKPVQRFEIVLGRIIGFVILMTIVLFVLSHISLMYIARGISEEAWESSVRARLPVFAMKEGGLRFEELDSNGSWAPRIGPLRVGREWEYRDYLRGGSTQEAVWIFPADMLPATLLQRPAELEGMRAQLAQETGAAADNLQARIRQLERVPLEFTFDIFRTTKGGDDYKPGVSCQFSFVNTRKWDFNRLTEYRNAVDPVSKLPMSAVQRAEEYGYYELPSPVTVTDYERFTLTFPAGVLKEIENGALQVRVACRSHGQYLGMARADLYILAEEGSFYWNFLKGMAGIWFLVVLVVTLGVVFSTYLNAVVSLMLTWVPMFCGLPRIRGFIQNLAKPTTMENPGGGPGESFLRLIWQQNLVTPLEQTPGVRIIQGGDRVLQVMFDGLLKVLPDLGQYSRTMFVAEGFNIPGSEMFVALMMLIGYLFPFLLIGYYLINTREVAG